jgi:Fe(3+) dicitrate transport protein
MRGTSLFLFLFIQFSLLSQNTFSISGEIRNSQTNEGIQNAYLYIDELGKGTISDFKGHFEIGNLPAGTYHLVASNLGFISSSTIVDLGDGNIHSLNIELTETLYDLPNVLIESISLTGGYSGIDDIHGSAHYISKKELKKFNHSDINKILKSIPGIQIQEEDGFGLRPNIGIRGTSTERSSKITLMEDGVLIAPAPYAAPSAYYFPTIGRMEGVEVLKGSSQIKHGPYTTGGALNLLSKQIPTRSEGMVDIAAGSFFNRKIEATYGSRIDNTGFLLQGFSYGSSGFKELDTNENTGFNKTDLLAKFGINSGETQGIYHSLKLKFGYTKEQSKETYLGLSNEDFEINPLQRYAASGIDEMKSNHQSYTASYTTEFSSSIQMNTTAYYNFFHRNWYKLDKVSNGDGSKVGISNILNNTDEYTRAYEIIKGADAGADKLYVKANNRSYKSAGIQSIAHLFFGKEKPNHKLNIGIRYHYDEMDRFQWVDEFSMDRGKMELVLSGTEGTESNRIISANALAAFARLDLKWNKFSLNPGIRLESMTLKREDYGKEDPNRTGINLSSRENKETVIIPGISFSYQAIKAFSLFGGMHKGFSPPSTQEGASPESSINYELGSKMNTSFSSGSLVLFYTDYSNLLGSDVSAGGGSGNDELYNGGKTEVKGIEASFDLQLDHLFKSNFQLPFSVKYSYTDATFKNTFESELEIWGDVNKGDVLPYLARHQLSTSITLESKIFGFNLQTNYHSPMLTKAGKESTLSDSYVMDAGFNIDLGINFKIRRNITSYINVINITNNISRIARHPAGLRPSTPRTIMAGIRFSIF